MSCVKFEYQTTSGNQVVRLYKDVRRRTIYDSFNRRYVESWNRLRAGGQIKPTSAYKC